MVFTVHDIQKILSCVDFAIAKIIAETLGRGYLTDNDVRLITESGTDIDDLIPQFPALYQSFLFGRLQAVLSPKKLLGLTYPQFKVSLPKMGRFSPNKRELMYYHVAANKTYTHIKGFGSKIKNDISASIAAEEVSFMANYERKRMTDVLSFEIFEGTVYKRTVKKIASNVSKQMKDWDVNWERIVATECQDIYNMGTAQCIIDENEESRVYFEVYPGACRHCIRLYTTHGIGSKPKVFNIQFLLANGTNYGVHSKNWKPTISPVHPYCRCNLRKLPDNFVWDENLGDFVPNINSVNKDKLLSTKEQTL